MNSRKLLPANKPLLSMEDILKENAMLRAHVSQLKQKVAELQAKLDEKNMGDEVTTSAPNEMNEAGLPSDIKVLETSVVSELAQAIANNPRLPGEERFKFLTEALVSMATGEAEARYRNHLNDPAVQKRIIHEVLMLLEN